MSAIDYKYVSQAEFSIDSLDNALENCKSGHLYKPRSVTNLNIDTKVSRSSKKIKYNQDSIESIFSVTKSVMDAENYQSRSLSGDATTRPAIPYSTLIAKAIDCSLDRKITLNEIYNYAMTHYPYFRSAGNGWKVILKIKTMNLTFRIQFDIICH